MGSSGGHCYGGLAGGRGHRLSSLPLLFQWVRREKSGSSTVGLQMLVEPLTLPLQTEDAVRRFYGLPRIRPIVSAASPPGGWSVVSPTVARTLNLSFRPWWDRMPPTEKVGTLWLYDIPRTE